MVQMDLLMVCRPSVCCRHREPSPTEWSGLPRPPSVPQCPVTTNRNTNIYLFPSVWASVYYLCLVFSILYSPSVLACCDFISELTTHFLTFNYFAQYNIFLNKTRHCYVWTFTVIMWGHLGARGFGRTQAPSLSGLKQVLLGSHFRCTGQVGWCRLHSPDFVGVLQTNKAVLVFFTLVFSFRNTERLLRQNHIGKFMLKQ